MPKRIPQKHIRQLVAGGGAVDLSKLYSDPPGGDWYAFVDGLKLSTLFTSEGGSGINGAVFFSETECRLYAVAQRDAALHTIL